MRKLPARKYLGAIVAAALLLPNAGYTLGLGEIEVNSALNQKLNADIELLSAAPEDTETIIVKLASRKEFTRAGIDRPYSLNDLRFKAEIIDGVPHIKVSSGGPIREPFLNFLVEIDWPNGHLIREYTVLLDPPVFMTTAAKPAAATTGQQAANGSFRPGSVRPGSGGGSNVVPLVAPVAVPASPASSASPRPASTMQAPAAQPEAMNQPVSQTNWVPAPIVQQQVSVNQPAGSYKIRSGDTAWSLADAMRPDQSITVPQMMIAMLRANPESFIDENINGLKRGYILRVPDYNQITSVSQADALALVREQAALWRQYQQTQSGGQPVSAMEADNMGGDGTATGDGAAASGQDDAYLEIVSAGAGASTSSGKDPVDMSAAELRAELALARERVETEQVEKEVLQERVNTLQQHVDKMKGMLSIEDAELAEVQSLNEPQETEPTMVDSDSMPQTAGDMQTEMDTVEDEATAVDQTGDQVNEEDMSGEGMSDEILTEEGGEPAEADQDAIFVDDTATDDAITESVEDEVPVQEEMSPDDSTTAQPPIVSSEPADPLTQLLNNPMMLAAAGGGLLLIAALIALIIKRRKSGDADESEEPGVSSGFDDLESLADEIAEEEQSDVDEALPGDLTGDSEASGSDDFDSDSTMILDSADDTIITEATPEEALDDEPRDDVIAEADVYLAYGIYQQAEELLTQAIADNPDRNDYRVKLAETHYSGKNAGELTRVANELKKQVDDNSPEWKKVMSMGQDLCPDAPIFQGSMVGAPDVDSITPAAPEMDFDLGLSDSEGEAETPDLDLTLDEEPLELPEMAEESVQENEPVDELEFDLTETGADEEAEVVEDEFSLDIDASELDIEEEAIVDDASEIDLDFGLDDVEAVAESETADDEISIDLTDEAASLDLDIGEDDLEDAAEAASETVEKAAEEEIDLDLDAGDVDLDLDITDTDSDSASEPSVAEADDDDDDFDLSNLDDVDEISTKLDLARAYLDMGDHEGTKGILEEVLAEGSDEQKQEANDLMAKLG